MDKLDSGALKARDEMMSKLIQLAQEEIKGERAVIGTTKSGKKIYEKATPNQPPQNRTGNLRRSIRGEKFREGYATYSAVVGPTMKYSRQVELGGGKWGQDIKFPYMSPAFQKFKPYAEIIIRKNLEL